jgi:N-acetylglucosamine-6-sulfatase
MHGRSLVPALKDTGSIPAGWRESIYYQYSGENTHAVAAHDGVRTARDKLMWFPRTKEWNLFDLEKDPQEMKSVHDDPEYAGVLAEMKEIYRKNRATYGVNDATVPAPRLKDGWWKDRHQAKKKEIARGGHELVFLGDSITQGWEGAGKEAWAKSFGSRKAINLGFSGDRTEHVLWRLFNGGFAGAKPKVLVLMIGTNNTGHNRQDPAETAAGIESITGIIRDRTPDTNILLVGVLPRGDGPEDPLRKINDELNRKLLGLADG